MVRNSFSFDLKTFKETDILIKVGIPFQSFAPKYFIDLRPYRNVFLMDWKMSPTRTKKTGKYLGNPRIFLGNFWGIILGFLGKKKLGKRANS